MKRFGMLIFFLLSFFSIKAQLWIEAGGKAMYGVKGFYNGNIIDDRDHLYRLDGSLAYGAVVNFNFSDDHGLSIEWLLAQNKQRVAFSPVGDTEIENDIQWKTYDAYLLYQGYFNASFIEIGGKISMVNSIEQTFVQGLEVENFYEKQYYSAVAGFGGYIAGSESFSLKMGLRFEYSISDFVSDKGEAENYPAFYTNYESYKGSHPFSGSVYLELKLPIGKLSKAECGNRQFVFGSRR